MQDGDRYYIQPFLLLVYSLLAELNAEWPY
jgi:hypothetical protein